MTVQELAMQQMHDDMVALTAALTKFTEVLESRKDIIEGGEPIPVELVKIGEDALAVLTAVTSAE